MKAYYKKTIIEQLEDIKAKADNNNKIISYVALTDDEVWQLYHELDLRTLGTVMADSSSYVISKTGFRRAILEGSIRLLGIRLEYQS